MNYFVQKNLVFGASFGMDRLFWYIVTVVVAGIVSVWMPPYIIAWLNPYVGGLAATIANVANIVAQVVINYPLMKFVIMRK